MSLHRKKWSQKEKEEVLLFAEEHRVWLGLIYIF